MPVEPARIKTASDLIPLIRAVGLTILTVVVVTALYAGRDFLVPLSLAVLLSFVLAKPASLLQRLRVPRPIAAIVVVLGAFIVIFALGGLIASQVNQLASDLPRYQSTIQSKIQSIRGVTAGSSALERAADILQELSSQLDQPRPVTASPDTRPMKVEVLQPDPTALQNLRSVLAPLISPLATTGITIIFVIFILIQKEDLRNRLIRLAGSHDLQRTTDALDDAASRLSRLFAAQLMVNSGFGVLIGLGLWAIGIPSPVLWGILGGSLRFVPYVGSIIAAVFPLALAAAVDPGWSMLVYTGLLFFIVEPAIAQIVEPLAFGKTTGLSPVSVVISATFWTALWGPIGLILATPLTVCFVVLGRHVKALEFIDVMFGDRPALLPEQIFYQRMLANDPVEAADKAVQFLKSGTLATYYDEVALPGLRLAQDDLTRSILSEERASVIEGSVRELTDDLPELDYGDELDSESSDPEAQDIIERVRKRPDDLISPSEPVSTDVDHVVAVIGARSALDQSVAHLFVDLCKKHSLQADALPPSTLSSSQIRDADCPDYNLVCISYLDTEKRAHMRLAARRIRRRFPSATIILGCWSPDIRENNLEDIKSTTGADFVVTTLTSALDHVSNSVRTLSRR